MKNKGRCAKWKKYKEKLKLIVLFCILHTKDKSGRIATSQRQEEANNDCCDERP
jgi:hypothetical protein